MVLCPGIPHGPKYPNTLLQSFFTARSQWGFPSSWNISSYMPRPVDSGRSQSPSPFRLISCCLRDPLYPWHPQQTLFRSCTSTSGDAVPRTACKILCLRFTCLVHQHPCRLRHRRKTRYGWVANPYPTGTSTPKDMPSFARLRFGFTRVQFHRVQAVVRSYR